MSGAIFRPVIPSLVGRLMGGEFVALDGGAAAARLYSGGNQMVCCVFDAFILCLCGATLKIPLVSLML